VKEIITACQNWITKLSET